MKIFLGIYGLISFTLIHGDFLTGDINFEDHIAPRIVNHNPYLNDLNRNPVLQYFNPIYDFPVIYYYPKPVPRPDAVVLIRKKTNSVTNFDPRVEISDFKPRPRITRSVWNDFDVKRIARKGESDSREFRNRTGNVVRIQTYKNHSPGSRSAKKVELVAVELSESVMETKTQDIKSPETEEIVATFVDQKEEKAESASKEGEPAKLPEPPQSSNKNDQIAQENQQFAFFPDRTSQSDHSARMESLESTEQSAKMTNLDDSIYTNSESSLYKEDYPFFPSQTPRKSLQWEIPPSQIVSQYLPINEDEKTMVYSYQNHQHDYGTSTTSLYESPELPMYSKLSDDFSYGDHSSYKTYEEISDSFAPRVPLDLHSNNPAYYGIHEIVSQNYNLESSDYGYFQPLDAPKSEISPENEKINSLITALTGETVTILPPHVSDALPNTTPAYGGKGETYPGPHQSILPSSEELETLEQALLKLQAELPTPNFESEPFLPYDMKAAIDSSISVPFTSYVTDFPYFSFSQESENYTEPKFHEQPPIY